MKTLEEKALVVKAYKGGLSTVQIGKEIGISSGGVRCLLISCGVKMRSEKEALQVKYPKGRYGRLAANWKGGIRWGGVESRYKMIYKPLHPYSTQEGYVMEHRLVMEAELGRHLEPTEFVHHINGNPVDNHPENLLVATKKEHAKAHFDAVKEVVRLKAENDQLKAKIAELTSNVQN